MIARVYVKSWFCDGATLETEVETDARGGKAGAGAVIVAALAASAAVAAVDAKQGKKRKKTRI